MYLAIFCAVRGNFPALQAILGAVDERGIETVFNAGNCVGRYPWPNEVIGLLRERNLPFALFHDRPGASPYYWPLSSRPWFRVGLDRWASRLFLVSLLEYLDVLPNFHRNGLISALGGTTSSSSGFVLHVPHWILVISPSVNG